MDIKKKTWIVGILVVVFVVTFSLFAFTDIFRSFDAQGYVEAVLEQKTKGEGAHLTEFTADISQKELRAQYEEEITSYVENNILGGVEATKEQTTTCVDTMKKIFSSFKYEVGEAKKTDSDIYQIPVTYQPVDVIAKFITLSGEEYERLSQMAYEGEEFKGESEEILAQIQKEFMERACQLLEQAYKDMEFGEQQTMTFTVQKGSDGVYKIDNDEIIEFVEKITGIHS